MGHAPGRIALGESFSEIDARPLSREALHDRARGYRFVRRIYRLRTVGLALGALCVASVLRMHDVSMGWWILLFIDGFVWPHAAMMIAMRSDNPRGAEVRNLAVDSLMGGLWVAVMQFNLLPSLLLVTMLSVDKVGTRRLKSLVRAMALMGAACAATSAAMGFPVQLDTPMSVIWACVPFLVIYPLAVTGVTNSLAQRITLQNRLLEELGRTDGLTGLANRRRCFAVAEAEFARHLRVGRPAVLMVVDVDRFKDINDRYGHPVGDDVLCDVARVLRECTRTIDTAARYGGDEFVVVMPETKLAGAEEVARRIRVRLAKLIFEEALDCRCTVSIGAAEAGPDMADVDAWITSADSALYRAKELGRDRFVGASTSSAVRSIRRVPPRP